MNIKKAAGGAAIAAALGLSPAVVQTISHGYRLRTREKKAEEKERLNGCPYPELTVSSSNGRNMREITGRLSEVPFDPKAYGGVGSTLVFSLADIIPMFLECRKSTCGMVYKYPQSFEKAVIESEDGTPVSGIVGVHPDGRPRPALLMVHGLFGSKNIWFSQQVILSAYYGWGFNVMAIDLRFFGESKLYSEAPGTGGWKEGQDIIAAVRYLKSRDEVTSVGVMGGSYGGASAMCAAYQSEPKNLIDGGIISWGGYGFIPEQVSYISRPPKPWEPFFPIYLYFMSCFANTLGKDVLKYRGFDEFLLERSADYYGVEPEEIMHRSSGAMHFDEVETPMLVINAQDDPVIPSEQAERMQRNAEGHPWVEVWNMPKGGHCAFSTVDRSWMSRIVRDFYGYWARTEA